MHLPTPLLPYSPTPLLPSAMRIGIVVDEFDPGRGGMEEWCRQFVAALAQRGHELHLVSQRFGEIVVSVIHQLRPLQPRPSAPHNERRALASDSFRFA